MSKQKLEITMGLDRESCVMFLSGRTRAVVSHALTNTSIIRDTFVVEANSPDEARKIAEGLLKEEIMRFTPKIISVQTSKEAEAIRSANT